jgi:tetratricopeptide (TPR) repeat protein
MRLWHDGATTKVREGLTHATELDPGFAAAWLELAVQTLRDDPTQAQELFQNAYEHREMLVARDSLFLEASEPYVRLKPDLPEWETRLFNAARVYPRDAELQYYLGLSREKQGDDEAARVAFDNAVRIDGSFVPALAALAAAQRNVGHDKKALETTDACLEASHLAAACLMTRVQLWNDVGDCHRMREEAAQWRSLESQSAPAQLWFSRGLFADGAPRPSVEEAVARRWTLVAPAMRVRAETWDRMHLAITDGDLMHAAELAKDNEAALPASADQWDHAQSTAIRAHLFVEMEKPKEAARIARDYLDRMDAWSPYVLQADPSIGFQEILFRAGAITRAQLDDARAKWRDNERKRVATTDRHASSGEWNAWMLGWGSLVETREEAIEAIAQLPAHEAAPIGARRGIGHDFNLGKVYALAGRADDAIPLLQRVTSTCQTLDNALMVLRARYYLGLAYEAKGDTARAREAYEKVVATWPRTSGSRTQRRATERLAAIGK